MVSFRFEVKSNRFPQAPALMRKAVGAAFASQKSVLLADMQRRTPVDEGKLRGSETAESDDTSLTLKAGGGDVDYALYVHAGARGTPSRPFMREAVEAGIPGIEQAIVDAANREFA